MSEERIFTVLRKKQVQKRGNFLSFLKNTLAVSEAVSTVVLTSVIMVIVITSSFFANSVLNANVEDAQFEQAINTVLSVEKITKDIMFKPYASGYVRTSFPTTAPYIVDTGILNIYLNETIGMASVPLNCFKIIGGQNVGVSIAKDYVGNDSLMLPGLGGSISHVHTYQSDGAWVALDFNRVRCVWSGVSNFYNGTAFELYNVVEITVIKLISGENNVLERSRVTIENIGIESYQIQSLGNFTLKAQLSDKEVVIYLSELGGNPNYPTLINLLIVDLKISILGGG